MLFRFNRSLCRTRTFVENVIGWWKRKFHSLHSELRIDVEHVPQYIIATAVLHNIAREQRFADLDDNVIPHQHLVPNNFNTGNLARRYIVDTYFNVQ